MQEVDEKREDDMRILYFRAGEQMSGTNYNDLIYKNIVWVEDLLAEKEDN